MIEAKENFNNTWPFNPNFFSGNGFKQHYVDEGKENNKVIFGGRLAEYKYYDMHQVIASALNKTKKIIQQNKTINYRKLLFEKGVSKISVIGVGMITTPGVTFRMFQSLANKKINIKVISTSEIKISVLIDKKNTQRALIALHKEFKLDHKK